MPRYDFTCQDCGHAFELRMSMSDYGSGEGRDCPGCGSRSVVRSFSAVNVIAGGSSSAAYAAPPRSSCGTGGFT